MSVCVIGIIGEVYGMNFNEDFGRNRPRENQLSVT